MGFESIPLVFGDFHSQPDEPPTCPLRPVIPKNTCPPPCLTATASTELTGASSSSPVMIAHSTKELYKTHCPSSLTRYCWIGLSPIVQDSPLQPPVESGPCLSPSVAYHPKRPVKHHWLGQPLPDQRPNTTQAHQTALFSLIQDLA